ncbi:hypothetical protein [Streptomyces sp. NPDC005573]|uniref:hypothetical protein n=1 Tax=Streptomyces sp. NPDC005573 TaxID=3156890 RepID=UPI0033B9013D
MRLTADSGPERGSRVASGEKRLVALVREDVLGGRSGDADGRERGLVLAGEFPAPGNPPGSAAEAGREA